LATTETNAFNIESVNRLRISFPTNPLVNVRDNRTEIDVTNLSADATDEMVMVSCHPHNIPILSLFPMHPLEDAEPDKEVNRPEKGRPSQVRMSVLHPFLQIRHRKDAGKVDELLHNGRTLRGQSNPMMGDRSSHLFNRIHESPPAPPI
jgi:hypothetical protein